MTGIRVLEKALGPLLVLFMATVALEGVLRSVLLFYGLEQVLYLRDLIPLLSCLLLLSYIKESQGTEIKIFFTLCLVATLVGLLSARSLVQVFFGIKIFLPLVLGMALGRNPYFTNFIKNPFIIVLFVLVCVGVVLEFYIPFAWKGVSYQLGGVEIENARSWTMHGINRISGFARASFAAATQALILALILCVRFPNRFVRIALLAIALTTVILTTTKGMVFSFIISGVSLWMLSSPTWRKQIHWVPICIAIATILSPLFLGAVLLEEAKTNITLYHLLSSMSDRINYEWPHAFALVEARGHWLYGAGMGSIGVPLYYFEPLWACPADNLFLYLYSTFGAVAVFMLASSSALARFGNYDRKEDTFCLLASVAALTMGLTANVIEDAFLSIFLGAAVSYFTRAFEQQRSHIPKAFAARPLPT